MALVHDEGYLRLIDTRGIMPDGFRASTAHLVFVPGERPNQKPANMNLACILLDEPSDQFAGVFTRNAFPGAPVIIARERLKNPRVRGILVNNKIANVRTRTGVEDAERICSALASSVGCEPEEIFPVSTGIIGWSLPVEEMIRSFPVLVGGFQRERLLPVARAIMTTDRFPKIRSVKLGSGRMVGIAKGAGMIEPNMATMLVFILTDVAFDRETAQHALARVVERSFNCISVDGDQSTSDMCLVLGSGRHPAVGEAEFEEALGRVCTDLAEDIVRNGEGCGHVIAMTVRGRSSDTEAREIAKAVVNSPLVKTAICGNDPNVGRILSSMGDYIGNRGLTADPAELEIFIGANRVFSGGVFELDKDKESALSAYFADAAMDPAGTAGPEHDRVVEITADFHGGPGAARVLGSDLTHEYVSENADYRS